MFLKRCYLKPVSLVVFYLAASLLRAQNPPETLETILNRLDALEKQNRELLAEIQSLRKELQNQNATPAGASSAESADQAAITQQRVEELAQTKVEASQKLPVQITGMVLFDAFSISGAKDSDFEEYYGVYSLGSPGGGAAFNQSIIGLRFQGPTIFGDGRVHGFLSADFYGGNSQYGKFRLRRAGVSFDWRRRSLTFSQDRTLLAPLEPTSYAHVGVPALSGAGNLWLWRPQVRYDEHIPLREDLTATLSGAVYETDESYNAAVTPSGPRPALQTRFELKGTAHGSPRFAVGIGAHASESHVSGLSVPSRLVNFDLLYQPVNWLQLTGDLFTGKNFANLGGVAPSINLIDNRLLAVRGSGGWMQLAFPVTRRLTLDAYAGRQDNRGSDLTDYQIVRTFTVAGNALYRLGSNTVVGFEAGREDVEYLNGADIFAKRFDATVAYLF